MKIIVDAMGGDSAPGSTVRGALAAAAEYKTEIVLVGRGEDILKVLAEDGVAELPTGVEIAHADQVVTMEDNPATAFKEKKDSSLTVGLTMLRDGKGDAFVTAGSTGALLSAATMLPKRIRGIRRAALAPVLPGSGSVLIDCGATAECKPEYLLQYAFMGSYYAGHVLGKPEPSVGLLNIGAEPSKGTALQVESYALLKKASEEGRINFVGNVEAREAAVGAVDVIVADGYTGNIMLKTMEGTGALLVSELKKMFMSGAKSKVAALLIQDNMKQMKKLLDPNEVGGTPLLGISKPVIKAHGSSNAYAIQNAVRQAIQFANSGIIEDIEENISYMRLPTKIADRGVE
jgi:glycerol-3-phosphate acyltransferase PlsX